MPQQPTTCQCSVALPSGAVGPCGNPARWRVSGVNVREHVCCDSCREEWERVGRDWLNPVLFDPPPANDPLDAMAARVADDTFFLASVIAEYQRRHGLDDTGLAQLLGCASVAVLTSLRLCRRPGAARPDRTAEEDVHDIAQRFGLDAAALGRIISETHAKATDILRKAARLFRDGDVRAARALVGPADALLALPGAAPEATYRARIALAAASAALAAGDADRCEDKLAEAFRELGMEADPTA